MSSDTAYAPTSPEVSPSTPGSADAGQLRRNSKPFGVTVGQAILLTALGAATACFSAVFTGLVVLMTIVVGNVWPPLPAVIAGFVPIVAHTLGFAIYVAVAQEKVYAARRWLISFVALLASLLLLGTLATLVVFGAVAFAVFSG